MGNGLGQYKRHYLPAVSPTCCDRKAPPTWWQSSHHRGKAPVETAADLSQPIQAKSAESVHAGSRPARLLVPVYESHADGAITDYHQAITLLRFHSALKKLKYRLLYSLRVMARHYKPDPSSPGQSWLTILGHAEESLWSVDLFRCESIVLKSHWVMVAMGIYTRRIIGFAVHAGHVDGLTLCRMFNDAISRQGWPKYLSSDNDTLYQFHRWKVNLPILAVEEIKSLPHMSISNPFVERLIASIRRQLLDHTFF